MNANNLRSIVSGAIVTFIFFLLYKYIDPLTACGYLVFEAAYLGHKIFAEVSKPIKIPLGVPDLQQEEEKQEKIPPAPAKNPIGFLWDGK